MMANHSSGGTWSDLWGTPILYHRTPADDLYNDALRDLILTEQRNLKGAKSGVVDADKTRSDLLRWQHPLIEQLRTWIAYAGDILTRETEVKGEVKHSDPPMIAEAWAVVYKEWGYHEMHSHHDAAWSGVYYVHTGNMTKGSGLIEWLDPRPAACAREPGRRPLHSMTPESGMLVAFPAWLQHWVTPYQGDSGRIVVAFNIGFER